MYIDSYFQNRFKMLPGVGIFISGGTVMKVLVPYLRAKGFKVESVWAPTIEAAKEAAEELDIPFHTHKIDDVLLKKEVDLVFIMCQPILQKIIAVKALGIGKHVVCDRPGVNYNFYFETKWFLYFDFN